MQTKDKIKILLISDTTEFALTDVYYGYQYALKSLGIDFDCFPFHRFKKVYLPETCFSMMHSTALVKESGFTHVIFIGGLNIPEFILKNLYHLKSIVVSTEDPHTFDPLKHKLDFIDYYFSNERTIGLSKKYKNSYYCPTAGCTHACGKIPKNRLDPKYHSDLLFLGAIYPNRRKLLESIIPTIEELKMDFKICGHVHYLPKKSPLWKYVADPRTIPHEETISYYNGAEIVMNMFRDIKWNPKTKSKGNPWNKSRFKAESLNPRAYEVPLCQAFMLMEDSRPEAREIYTEDEVGFFSDEETLSRAISYFFKNKSKRELMASRAFKKASLGHTYTHRLIRILDTIG